MPPDFSTLILVEFLYETDETVAMSSTSDSPQRTLKAKKAATNAPPFASPGYAAPTTFFLRSEREVEKSVQQRGRKISRDSDTSTEETAQTTPMASQMGDSTFGVQSLESTISGATYSDETLSRTNSNVSDASVESGSDANILAGRKRKAGNPVHPKIIATGQRIISEGHITQLSGSPMSHRSAESPLRAPSARRNSVSSSMNLSRPLTPLKMSPRPESAMPSTPRSGSPKSFRLSDEEQSIASDAGSQAIVSSNGDENEPDTENKVESMPQLVMPSIALPTRRAFTERGKQIGRLKVMIAGPRGVGKTSLIQSICKVCEDVVHMDAISVGVSAPNQDKDIFSDCERVVEIGASTRPYPAWWTDFESRRMLLRRKSTGEGVLERNLTFIETPGLDTARRTQSVMRYFQTSLSRTAKMESMHDTELISMLSGDGGVQIDAVLYLFDPVITSCELFLSQEETELLRYLCKWTNVIPLIARSDLVNAEDLVARKKQVLSIFKTLQVEPCIAHSAGEDGNEERANSEAPQEPYAVSSALGDDSETIDASTLMSSTYLQPLVPSDLDVFVSQFLEPGNIARLRHLSATKFLLWRQEHLGKHIDLQKQVLLQSPRTVPSSPAITGTGSILDDPSKVLVPHGSSSYFRSASPSASESSALSGNATGASAQALARYNDQTNTSVPFRQVRLAKWAQDLQRSLENERRRYKNMFTGPPSDWATSDSEKAADPNSSLVATNSGRPAKGRLGGALGIVDPRDPLGVLAFSQAFTRHGWFALQIAGSCGLIGALMWWAAKNWADLQEFLGLAQPPAPITVNAVPAPTKGWFEDVDWKNIIGLQR